MDERRQFPELLLVIFSGPNTITSSCKTPSFYFRPYSLSGGNGKVLQQYSGFFGEFSKNKFRRADNFVISMIVEIIT